MVFASAFACVSPSNEERENVNEQGEWSDALPSRFFDQQNNTAQPNTLTNLRDPDQKDSLEGAPRTFAPYPIAYNLLRADRSLSLPEKLGNIAGLSTSPDGRSLVALNYKDGDIHYINMWNGELEKSVRFKRRGQYKGIESVRNDIFIIKENGSVFHVSELHTGKPKTKVFNTHLNAKYAVHGLAYHPFRNELLLACQGNDGDEAFDNSKSIYVFDLDSKEVFRQPMFLIEDQDIIDFMNQFKSPEEEGDELFYQPALEKTF